MVEHRRLGDYEQVSRWAALTTNWSAGRAKFGHGRAVIDDFLAGIQAFPTEIAERYPRNAEATPLAVGCVPWLTHDGVVDALLELERAVVAVNKDSRATSAVRRLAEADVGVRQSLFRKLEDFGPRGTVIVPGSPMPGDEAVLGPVRLVGHANPTRSVPPPLLHAKLLVLCAWWYGEGEFGEEVEDLTPIRAWVGSANWTFKSAEHLEFGTWIDDETFAADTLEFLVDVLSLSEPFGSTFPDPEPDLKPADWDDEAFLEAWRDREESWYSEE